jgi:MFS family permease
MINVRFACCPMPCAGHYQPLSFFRHGIQRTTAFLICAIFAVSCSTCSFQPILAPHLSTILNTTPWEIGLVLGAQFLVYVLFGGLLVMRAHEALGEKLCVILGLGIGSVSYLVFGPAPFLEIQKALENKKPTAVDTVAWITTLVGLGGAGVTESLVLSSAAPMLLASLEPLQGQRDPKDAVSAIFALVSGPTSSGSCLDI